MRDLDSPITCTSFWGPLSRRALKHRVLMRDSRLSKFKAGYKQHDPYVDDFMQSEDVFNFLCAQPPGMR
jgi:hypothetical protein